MSVGSRKFAREIARRAKANTAAKKALERENALKRRQRETAAALVIQTSDGLHPNKRLALCAAQKKAESDPRMKAKVEAAEVDKRVRDTRKLHGIGEDVRPVNAGGGVLTDPGQIPMSVAQRRAAKVKKGEQE